MTSLGVHDFKSLAQMTFGCVEQLTRRIGIDRTLVGDDRCPHFATTSIKQRLRLGLINVNLFKLKEVF